MFAETRLLMEYLRDYYPGREWFTQLAIGRDPEMVGVQLQDDAERRLVRRFCRRVDAVVVQPDELVIIEATMHTPTEKIGRLLEYLLLIPATPELEQYFPRKIVGELVTGQDDAVARTLCERQGLRYVHYEAEWFAEFWAMYPQRRRRTPHAGMIDALAEKE
jgi:hypothetical protein